MVLRSFFICHNQFISVHPACTTHTLPELPALALIFWNTYLCNMYYAFKNISLSHYNTTCMTWLWCDDLISYTFPLEWRIWLLPFPHNTSHFAPVLRFPALCFDIIRCSHGLRTPRERIFKKIQTFGLVQTNWAENFGGIWDIFGQNTAPILALWVPCPWFWVIGCFFLSTKNFGFQT